MYSKKAPPTHCCHGHAIVGDNILHRKSGQLSCKQCEKDRYQANRLAILKQHKQYWASLDPKERKDRSQRRALMHSYGMTPEDKQKMFVEQAGLCHICKRPMESCEKSVIDHNHYTDEVRGLAHDPCNTRLGTIECLQYNDPDTLKSMLRISGF